MSNELIKQYQLDPANKELGDKLLEIHAPYIKANINKWSGILPQEVLNTYGRHYALEAFKTYNPERASINTHLYNQMSQLSRLIYMHQNVSNISEHQLQDIGRVNQTRDYLKDQLDREPTVQEISHHVKLPINHIERVLKNQRADFVNDSDLEHQQFGVHTTDTSKATTIFSYRNSLDDKQKKQFDLFTGYNDTTPLSPKEFGLKFKLKPYEVTRLKQHFAKGMK